MNKIASVLIATVSSAIVPAIALSILTPINAGGFSFGQLLLAPVFYVFALAALTILGIPLYLLLVRLNLDNWWMAAVAGVVGGMAVALLVRLPNTPEIRDFFAMCSTGVATALVFWALLRVLATQQRGA